MRSTAQVAHLPPQLIPIALFLRRKWRLGTLVQKVHFGGYQGEIFTTNVLAPGVVVSRRRFAGQTTVCETSTCNDHAAGDRPTYLQLFASKNGSDWSQVHQPLS